MRRHQKTRNSMMRSVITHAKLIVPVIIYILRLMHTHMLDLKNHIIISLLYVLVPREMSANM